ncbi:hypothetical protein EDB89DRAFT_409019 [Lactarius sanguifluus]|nr:hypothetical protein EDB89DRAFT_409019 [Lactarius sanguifluus]
MVCLLLVNNTLHSLTTPLLRGRHRICLGHLRHHPQFFVLEVRLRAEYGPVHLRHPRPRARLSRRNHDLGSIRTPEFSHRSTDHLLVAHSRQAEHADPATAAFPLACMGLPHCRHQTPATEYVHGPPHTLRAVPRMIDLDLSVTEVVNEDADVASGRRGRSSGPVKRRGPPSGSVQEKAVTFEEVSEGGTVEDVEVKHHDSDVLTKVVVYVGIGAIATVMVPALFEALERGV